MRSRVTCGGTETRTKCCQALTRNNFMKAPLPKTEAAPLEALCRDQTLDTEAAFGNAYQLNDKSASMVTFFKKSLSSQVPHNCFLIVFVYGIPGYKSSQNKRGLT